MGEKRPGTLSRSFPGPRSMKERLRRSEGGVATSAGLLWKKSRVRGREKFRADGVLFGVTSSDISDVAVTRLVLGFDTDTKTAGPQQATPPIETLSGLSKVLTVGKCTRLLVRFGLILARL